MLDISHETKLSEQVWMSLTSRAVLPAPSKRPLMLIQASKRCLTRKDSTPEDRSARLRLRASEQNATHVLPKTFREWGWDFIHLSISYQRK